MQDEDDYMAIMRKRNIKGECMNNKMKDTSISLCTSIIKSKE